MSKIKLENLQKKYGKVTALDEFALDINDKELIVFLGPSGCGKTTTLNCIAGIEEPTHGRIFFDDKEVTNLPSHARNVLPIPHERDYGLPSSDDGLSLVRAEAMSPVGTATMPRPTTRTTPVNIFPNGVIG